LCRQHTGFGENPELSHWSVDSSSMNNIWLFMNHYISKSLITY